MNTVTVLNNQEQEKTLKRKSGGDDAPGAKRRKDATREESEADDDGTLDEPSDPNTAPGTPCDVDVVVLYSLTSNL